MLTQDRLKELLHYDPEMGVWTWLVRPNRRIRIGSKAGSLVKGYFNIGVDGEVYAASRLAVFYMTGNWPSHGIDHWDGVTTNDRFGNLRDITQQRNLHNRCGKKLGSGVKGVSWVKRDKEWLAQICVNGTRVRLLQTPDKEEARDWYEAFADLAYGIYAYHNRPSIIQEIRK